jgi:hypothetical protein
MRPGHLAESLVGRGPSVAAAVSDALSKSSAASAGLRFELLSTEGEVSEDGTLIYEVRLLARRAP